MAVFAARLTRRQSPSGQVVVRLGDPLLDAYLEFVEARCRPNSVLAAGFDLQVFFTVVPKPPGQVTTAERPWFHHRPACWHGDRDPGSGHR